MGTMTTTSKSLNTKAEYEGEGLKISVKYSEDAVSGVLNSVEGQIHKAEEYAGNFVGALNNGEIEYSMSGVKSKDKSAVVAAITDIEEQIPRENSEEE